MRLDREYAVTLIIMVSLLGAACTSNQGTKDGSVRLGTPFPSSGESAVPDSCKPLTAIHRTASDALRSLRHRKLGSLSLGGAQLTLNSDGEFLVGLARSIERRLALDGTFLGGDACLAEIGATLDIVQRGVDLAGGGSRLDYRLVARVSYQALLRYYPESPLKSIAETYVARHR